MGDLHRFPDVQLLDYRVTAAEERMAEAQAELLLAQEALRRAKQNRTEAARKK